MFSTRHHITLAESTVVDYGQVTVESTLQEILINQDFGPVLRSVNVAKGLVGNREANCILVILEISSNLIEKLAGQADRPGARHQPQ